MKVLIAGAGTIGFYLARQIASERHDVFVVEKDPELAQRISAKLDAMVVEGNAGSPAVLERAGIREADMVVAVTNSDELNMIVCLLARNYGVARRVARVRSSEFSGENSVLSHEQLAIDVAINPEEVAAATMLRLVQIPGAIEVAEFSGGQMLLVAFAITSEAPIIGKTLAQIRQGAGGEFLVLAILRREQLIIPRGDAVLHHGDHVYVFVPREFLPLFQSLLRHRIERVRKIIVSGASRIGRRICVGVEKLGLDCTLVDEDRRRCEAAAATLAHTQVICGSPTDSDVLHECHLGGTDLFLSCSEDDESNMMTALLAKKHGVPRTMVVIENAEYVPLLRALPIDVVVSPRLVAAGEILRFIRRGAILSMVRLAEFPAEALEIVAEEGSALVGRPIRELRLPKGALIGAVVKHGHMTIPTGDTVVQPGEKAIIFAQSETIEAVQQLLARSST